MRVALILVLLAGACGPGEVPVAGPDAPATGAPAPGPTASEGPLLVEPRPGLVDVRARSWDAVRPLGPRRLLVTFWSGVEECTGVARVRVRGSPEAVEITLFEGRVPGARVCIEIALLKGVVVTLDEPLGDRGVVDGAGPPRG